MARREKVITNGTLVCTSVDLSILIRDNSIDSERTFPPTCGATIVSRPLKFDTSHRFA